MATMTAIQLEPVTSSRLAAIGYDEETFTLAVRFPPTKKSPAGKIYHYSGVSEEVFDDMKNAESIGVFFGETIIKNPERYPCLCVDEGTGEPQGASSQDAPAPAVEAPPAIAETIIPDDEEGLKALAMSARSEATMLSITTADECEAASREVLRIRTERVRAIEKVNKIKIPATQAWKAACDLFNEVDGKYKEAEKFLDDGILSYRAKEKRRIADENARLAREEEARQAEARRLQQEEHKRLQKIADDEAAARSAALAEEDAQIAAAQGAAPEEVQQIRETPVPVIARHVAPPPLAYAAAPQSIAVQNIPKVAGLAFTTEWLYEITDESLIPVSHEYYTLDRKKVNAKVQALKQHANIAGVRVYSEERSIKRTAK